MSKRVEGEPELTYEVAVTIDAEFVLQKGDHLIVFGALKDIDRFCESAD